MFGRGKGVGLAAHRIQQLLDLVLRAFPIAAAGDQMFQQVAQAGAQLAGPRRRCPCCLTKHADGGHGAAWFSLTSTTRPLLSLALVTPLPRACRDS